MDDIEFRCPANPSKKFASVDSPVITSGNLISIACRHCRDEVRKTGAVASRVIHRFNVLGHVVETEVQDDDQRKHSDRT